MVPMSFPSEFLIGTPKYGNQGFGSQIVRFTNGKPDSPHALISMISGSHGLT
nr:MAG TPA_asm: hypothetical protein [Caudoviricetes sp.]